MKFNILDLLLPREKKFYTFFKEQGEVLKEASHLFRDLAVGLKGMSEDKVREAVAKIKDCEHRGDQIEAKIIKELHDTFITPFDREDIHAIALQIDKSLDILTALSNKIELYGIRKLPKNAVNFADLIVEIADVHKKLIDDLEPRTTVDALISNLHSIEKNADFLFYISVGDLFKKEDDPIELIKNKEIYELLEAVVDAIDLVGKIIRRVMIKQG